MNAREIREKTVEEVNNDLLAAEENVKTIHFQLVTAQLDNTSVLNTAKKEVAKLKTVIQEHKLGIHTLVDPGNAVDGEGKK
jgi:large subunit ribosomal protein L29